MIEVEVRSLVGETMQARVQETLAQMSLQSVGASLDVYYDSADFALLRHPQMVFLRRREKRLLQVKYNAVTALQQLVPCIEREFVLDASVVPTEMHALMRTFLPSWQAAHTWPETIQINHLAELARIEKHRSVYTDGPFIICFDEVTHLGQFIEVEINLPEGSDIREAQGQVEAFLAEIGGTPLKAGYFEMYLYYYNHEAYQIVPPRFQVEEELLPIHTWRDHTHQGRK